MMVRPDVSDTGRESAFTQTPHASVSEIWKKRQRFRNACNHGRSAWRSNSVEVVSQRPCSSGMEKQPPPTSKMLRELTKTPRNVSREQEQPRVIQHNPVFAAGHHVLVLGGDEQWCYSDVAYPATQQLLEIQNTSTVITVGLTVRVHRKGCSFFICHAIYRVYTQCHYD